MRIEVTKEDIAQGRRRDPSHCPVGRAVSRAGVPNYCVAKGAVIISHQSQPARALLLSEAVQHWILDFDQQKPVQPISFELGLPVPVGCRGAAPLATRDHTPADPRAQAGLAAALGVAVNGQAGFAA